MANETASALGRRLKAARGRTGLSQLELASRAGVDPGTVSGIELGQIERPLARTLARLADALEITVDYLEGYEPQAGESRPDAVEVPPSGAASPPRG